MVIAHYLLTGLMIWTSICFRSTDQLKIVYAVNCGGDAHTDSNGINYQKDTSTEGDNYTFPVTITGIGEHDRLLYQTCRYKNPSVNYDLPLTGDGWYGLLLHFADDSATKDRRRLQVILNGQHTLLTDLNLYRDCGQHNVCNQIFYFKVCGSTLHYAGQTSTIWDSTKVNVNFKMLSVNAIINGILLVKGRPGEGLAIVGTKTVFFFDPKKAVQCEGSKGNGDKSGSVVDETNNKCTTDPAISIIVNVHGTKKQTFKLVPENNVQYVVDSEI